MLRSRRLRAFGVILLVTWGLTTHGKPSVSGDEPHYLVQTESLLTDGDLDLTNNYAQDDARLFGRPGLVNDGHAVPRPEGGLGSTHDVGLAVLVLPAYALARAVAERVPEPLLARARMNRGLFSYALVSVAMIALVAWCTSGLLPALETAWPRGHAEVLLYVVALSPPVLSHAFLLFPDTAMFAAVCVVAAFAARGAGAATTPLPPLHLTPRELRRLFVVALLLGLAPWLHRKFSPLVIALALSVVWMRRDELRALGARPRAALLALLVVPHALLYAWSWWQWHSLLGPQFVARPRLDVLRLPAGLLGLVGDEISGLLAYAPVYAVLPAGALLAAPSLRPLIVAAAALIVPVAAFDEWWGGYAPAARYLVPVMPIAAVCLASALRRRSMRHAVIALGVLQVAIDALVWQSPRHLWPRTGGNSLHTALGPPGDLLRAWLPDMRGAESPAAIAIFLASLAVLTWWLSRERDVRDGVAEDPGDAHA